LLLLLVVAVEHAALARLTMRAVELVGAEQQSGF
jgi:hypothetical protein